MKLSKKLEGRSRLFWLLAGLWLLALVGVADYLAGFETFFSVFYLLGVGLATWFVGRAFGLLLSVLSVIVWIIGDLAAGAHFSTPFVPIWNATILLVFYFIVVWLLARLRSLHVDLEKKVRERTVALTQEMQERTRLEKELLEISERGQREIGHDLHDVLGQHLTATAFASQVLTEQLEARSLPEAASAQHLVKLVEEAINLTRTFARGLQPVEMEAQGLMDGFQELARASSERFKIACEFECREPVLLDDTERSTQLYRIAQEAITNAIKHGKAKSINVSLENLNDAVTLTITDDGAGLPENARLGQGMGLHIMAYRARMIGATFDIERLPESGTRVTCKLPADKILSPETHAAKN